MSTKKISLIFSMLIIFILAFTACTSADETVEATQPPVEATEATTTTEGPAVLDPNRSLKIISVQHALCAWDSFWCTEEDAIRDAAGVLGVEVEILGPDKFDLEKTATLIEQAVAAQPDGIIVTITDADLFREPLLRAIEAGIPVVAFNSGGGPEADGIPYLTLFAQDEYLAGYQAANRLAAAAGDGDHYAVCINHGVGSYWGDTRCSGFAAAMDELGIPSEVLGIGDDPAESTTIIGDYYAAHPEADIFVTLGPTGANPFYAFVENQGLTAEDVTHGTFDLSPEINEHIRSGLTQFGIDQQPFLQGYNAIQTIVLLLRYGVTPTMPITPTGPGFVTIDNIDTVGALAGVYR
jgi:simple sugar transport system substrate-binding protein